MGHDKQARGLSTLEKCVQILTLFTDEAPTLRVSDIADTLQLPRSTAYRYMAALRSHRFIEESPNGGYRLGNRILELAATIRRRPLSEIACPHMSEIAELTGETVILCGLRGHVGVCLEKVDGTHTLRVSHELGDTYPLHAGATGKAILAYLEGSQQQEIIDDVGLPRITDSTITRVADLLLELQRVRTVGYSESKGESIEGTHGIAAPIFDSGESVVASIGVSIPTHRAVSENRERVIGLLVEAAKRITEGLTAQEGTK